MDVNLKKSVDFAAKWWADHLDGTIFDVKFCSEFREAFDRLKEIFGLREEDGFEESEFLLHMARQYPQYLVQQDSFVGRKTRQKFEQTLSGLIMKEIEQRGISILHFDVQSGADFTLGVAAEQCGIEHGADSPFSFEEYVLMFVDKDGVSVKFSEDDVAHDLFVAKRDKNLN